MKISTTSFVDQKLLNKSISNFKKLYISISGIKEFEVQKLYKYLKYKKSLNKVTFLFGHQNVPTLIENTNLSRLIYYKKKYRDVNFGFMDHISGNSNYKYSLSAFVMGMGINCFEKHLTFSRKKKLIDSTSALEEKEFKNYVQLLHDHKKAIGKYTKVLTQSENNYRKGALTVLHAKTLIKKNQKILYENIVHKRSINYSNTDISDPDKVIGKIAKYEIKINKPIKLSLIK